MISKICSRCGIEKPLGEFHKDNRSSGVRKPRAGGGVSSRCKVCASELHNPNLKAQRDATAELQRKGLKQCGKCHQPKPFSDFHKRVASNDGLAYKCTVCVNSDTSKWREKKPDAYALWHSKNRDRKSSRDKVWRENHREHLALKIAEWARLNPHKVNANISKRRAAKLRAIPPWADLAAVAAIYLEAAKIRKSSGMRYEVDHIVPLQGKTVSGLHWAGNLQIILKSENISKHNRRWPGMVVNS